MFHPFPKDLLESKFIERPNRFIIRCVLTETGEIVEAHLADSGRLKELLIPGKQILLHRNNNPNRKTKYSAVIVEREDGLGWVSLNAQLPNKLAKFAVEAKLFKELQSWEYVRSEYKKGHSRWDMLLQKSDDEAMQMVIEVKGATLVENGVGMFPDAVTSRGTKHVKELGEIVKESGWEAALLFVSQREDIHMVRPAYHIDPKFAKAMTEAKTAGVKLLGCRCKVSPSGIELLDAIDVEV